MRLPVLAAAAMLMAGPAFAQGTTTTPSGTTAAPPGATTAPQGAATQRAATPQSLTDLDAACRGGNQQACQDATRMRASSGSSSATTAPAAGGGAAMPTAPAAPGAGPRRVVPRGGDLAGPVGHPTGPSPPPRRTTRLQSRQMTIAAD